MARGASHVRCVRTADFFFCKSRCRTENERHQMAAASAPPPADDPLGLDEEHPPTFKPDVSGKDKVRMLSQCMCLTRGVCSVRPPTLPFLFSCFDFQGSRHSPPPGSEFGPGRTLTVKNPIPVPPPGGHHRRTNSGECLAFFPGTEHLHAREQLAQQVLFLNFLSARIICDP